MAEPYHRLETLLIHLGLPEAASQMLRTVYVCPGLTPQQLGQQCGFKRMKTYRTLQWLQEQGYVQFIPQGRNRIVGTDLSKLARRVDQKAAQFKRWACEIEDIRRLLRYPEAEKGRLHYERYFGEEAKEHLMDAHFHDWDCLLGFGEIEGFLAQWGYHDYDRKWVDQRLKNSRKAFGVLTRLGPWTQELISDNDTCMRKTKTIESSFHGQWIVTLPKAHLTYVFTNANSSDECSVTSIVSPEISQSYARMIRSFL